MVETHTPERHVSDVRDLPFGARRLAGLCFFALAVGFMTFIMLAGMVVPGYDFAGGAISDLGVAAETALLLNAALVLVGVLNVAGGYLYFRSHGNRWLFGAFLVAGVGAVGAGVFTLADPTGLHGVFALVAFLFFNVQAVAVAPKLTGPMRYVAALLGLVGFVFVVLMALGDAGNAAMFGPIGHGGAERMIVYPPMLALVALGGYLMASRPDDAEVPAV